MSKIEFVTHEKNGLNYITLAPPAKLPGMRLKLTDAMFFAGLLAGVVALIVFLVK